MATLSVISPRMLWRVFADILLVCGVFLFPWWIVLLCACVLFFTFGRFFELFLVAFLIDLLYGSPVPYFFNSSFVLSLGAVALYLALSTVRKKMRF